MKRNLLTAALVSCLILSGSVQAQSLESSFEFLKLPVAAHSSSLGGRVVSVYDASPALFVANPALLSANGTRLLGLNAMTWFSGTTVAGAQFSDLFDERSHYAFNARYVSYGKMKETTADGTVTGTFTAKDIAVGATWAYMLTDNLSGGVTGNLITSRYGSMTSVAIGVDLGLLYNAPDKGISIGLAATNLGGQIKAFENTFQKLPFDICAGITWQPEHAPLRFTVSMDNLTRWDAKDFYFADDARKGFGEILMFDISYGKYQVSESSLICNFGFNI